MEPQPLYKNAVIDRGMVTLWVGNRQPRARRNCQNFFEPRQ